MDRSIGTLLHLSSLPNCSNKGSLGENAFHFADFLSNSRQKYWQILPLNPPLNGNCPYQCLSAFAGNPAFISNYNENSDLKTLNFHNIAESGFLYNNPSEKINFEKAFQRFIYHNSYWLEDFALYMSIKQRHDGAAWIDWDMPLRDRLQNSILQYKKEHINEINLHKLS